MLAKLCHRYASQRESRRVVSQGDALERAEGVAGGKSARCGGD
jgi:hypothetical protein